MGVEDMKRDRPTDDDDNKQSDRWSDGPITLD